MSSNYASPPVSKMKGRQGGDPDVCRESLTPEADAAHSVGAGTPGCDQPGWEDMTPLRFT